MKNYYQISLLALYYTYFRGQEQGGSVVVQACIYDYLDTDVDPLLHKIENLKTNEDQNLGSGIIVTKNTFNIYEIATDELHESFKSVRACYEYVLQLIDEYANES